MTSYREQLKFFFDKLNLAKVKWDIVADDGTIHPFTNHDVIDTFKSNLWSMDYSLSWDGGGRVDGLSPRLYTGKKGYTL